jgi:DNA-binding Xre family transcriptional regulator
VTWIPIPGGLRKQRVARKLEKADLAKVSGVRERTLRLLESKKAPKTMQRATVMSLAKALGCVPEDLAKWVPYGADKAADPDLDDPRALPPKGTLNRRADQERALGRAAPTVTTASGEHELLGPDLLSRLFAACAVFKDRRVAVEGLIRQFKDVPAPAAAMLGIPVGVGSRFELARNVAKNVPFYATVYTTTVEHTAALMHREGRVTVIARVVVAPPDGEWKGFFIFEKRPRPHAWALIVDEIP